MPAERTTMRHVREVLRLKFVGGVPSPDAHLFLEQLLSKKEYRKEVDLDEMFVFIDQSGKDVFEIFAFAYIALR